jgi:bifunctional non-homologous end joining protein LigD
MVYFAFDLLYLDGFDLRNAPLVERKRVLAALLEDARSECIQLSQHLEIEPGLVYEQACAMGLEGIICSSATRPIVQRAARSGSKSCASRAGCFRSSASSPRMTG